MDNYYAVLKLSSTAKAMTTGLYQAQGVDHAIEYMLKEAGVRSTMELYEYELLKVVGRNYQVAARKVGTKYSGNKMSIVKAKPSTVSTSSPATNIFNSVRQKRVTLL